MDVRAVTTVRYSCRGTPAPGRATWRCNDDERLLTCCDLAIVNECNRPITTVEYEQSGSTDFAGAGCVDKTNPSSEAEAVWSFPLFSRYPAPP
jgi:hypothetical protein